ncbi:hypothetical protein QMK33_01590 [Hymenobacter sp. H14-R3]|nr:hypothetical protein [Hymenobacter sp. H14-R3]MDJ0363828.1 hypothetical protein [Hymenobacter sp. H14-R3]
MNTFFSLALVAVLGLTLRSYSLGHSVSNDLKSSSPAVASQAQRVVDIRQ